MKNLTVTEFKNAGVNVSEYDTNRINEAQKLADEVNNFYPCELFIQCSEHEGKLYFEHPKVYLKHPDLQITISKDHKKKYHVNAWESMRQYKNVSNYGKGKIEEGLTRPVTIGVLSEKKILAWVNYYEELARLMAIEDKANNSEKEAFLRTIEGLNVTWFNNNKSGEIVQGGLKFTFKIEEEYISTKIDTHWDINNDLSTFLKMSANQYKKSEIKPVTV